MTTPVPTRDECLHASQRMDLRSKRTLKGTPTFFGLQFHVHRPESRKLPDSKQNSGQSKRRKYSTGRINALRAGALLIAAGGDETQVRPALLRASKLLHGYVYLPGADSFSELAAYLALQMLRSGWRAEDEEVSRECAELAARKERTAWWSESSLDFSS